MQHRISIHRKKREKKRKLKTNMKITRAYTLTVNDQCATVDLGVLCPCAYLQYELHHLGVNQAMDRLSVDVRDEVSLPQPRLMGRTSLLHMLRARREREGEMTKGGKERERGGSRQQSEPLG